MKKTAIFLAVCVLLCACNRSFTFIHMSDSQIGFIDASPGFGHTDTLMKKALNQALAQSPDLVINTGDLVNDPSSAVQDSIYTENLKALGTVPYWAVPGNHDILPYSRQNRELYLARRGYDHFSFRHKGWTFIGLDSNCIKNNDTAAEDAQLEWLVSELSSARKGRILVFFHHPVIKQDFDEPEEYFNFPMNKRRQYVDLFRQYGVKAVFTGHTHCPSMIECEGILFCTAGAVGSPLGGSRSGYAIVRVKGGELQWEFVPTV